jgi:hypothetical protein
MAAARTTIGRIGETRAPDYDLNILCPRCERNYLRGGRPEPISRADNATEICAKCGQIEAWEESAGIGLVPPSAWPVDATSYE